MSLSLESLGAPVKDSSWPTTPFSPHCQKQLETEAHYRCYFQMESVWLGLTPHLGFVAWQRLDWRISHAGGKHQLWTAVVISESFISQDEKNLGLFKLPEGKISRVNRSHCSHTVSCSYVGTTNIGSDMVKKENWHGNGHAVFKVLAGSVSLKLFICNHFSHNICSHLSWMTSHRV